MIRRKIGQSAIMNRLNRLETAQNSKDHISSVVFGTEDDGKLWTFNLGKGGIYFENMFEVENYLCTIPGVTKDTVLIIDNVSIGCDLYLPTEPIMYFCNSEERRQFIAGWENPSSWMEKYIMLIQRVLTLAIEKPDMPLPGFDDPALKDLMQNKDLMSIEQLVKRYEDQMWFEGNKK